MTDDQFAAHRGRGRAKPRRHKMGNLIKSGGRYVGRNGNCVRVVMALTGIGGAVGNGKNVAFTLHSRGWKPASINQHQRGDVCSWVGGRHGFGHVGYFDGQCFQPTYGGNCGSPGSKYRMVKCVRRH